MSRCARFLVIALSISFWGAAMADDLPSVEVLSSPPASSIPASAIPMVKCMRDVLKSSSAVQSVSLYSVDGFRFAIEYVFRDKNGQAAVFDDEMFIEDSDGSVTAGDKIPREISEKSMNEAEDLETKLGLETKCHLESAMDNILPQPPARSNWRKLAWPN
jgi:hypothetical protein